MIEPKELAKDFKWGLNGFIAAAGISLMLISVSTLWGKSLTLQSGDKLIQVNNAAIKLDDLAEQLEEQARLIEQKDEAYAKLENIYRDSLKGKQGYGRLQQAIEAVKVIPQANDIDEIKSEIIETEQELLESTTDY